MEGIIIYIESMLYTEPEYKSNYLIFSLKKKENIT